MEAPRRRRVAWAALAAALLVGTALLLSFADGEPAPTERVPVAFPTEPRPAERERAVRRATLALPAPPAAIAPAAAGTPAPPKLRDPFLVALPVRAGTPFLVLEANAIRHSRIGELLVGCLLAKHGDAFAMLERELGLDPLKDVDRVGFAGDAVVVSGFFDRVRWDGLGIGAAERYGADGRIWTRTPDGTVLGAWGGSLVISAPDAAAVRTTIDRLEGRAPVPEVSLPEMLAYGEAYGALPGSAAELLFAGHDAELARRIGEAARLIELHVDAAQDLATVVRVRGDDGGALSDLSRAVAGLLSGARVEARARGDGRVAELLDAARVVRGDGSFSVELAVPAERLDAWFAGCGAPDAEPAATGAP